MERQISPNSNDEVEAEIVRLETARRSIVTKTKTPHEQHMDILLSISKSLQPLHEIAAAHKESLELQREVIRRLEDLKNERNLGTGSDTDAHGDYLRNEGTRQREIQPRHPLQLGAISTKENHFTPDGANAATSVSPDANPSEQTASSQNQDGTPNLERAGTDASLMPTPSETKMESSKKPALKKQSSHSTTSDSESSLPTSASQILKSVKVSKKASDKIPLSSMALSTSTNPISHDVFCRFNVFNIQEINIKKQCIKVDFYFEAAWEMPELAYMEDVQWSEVWQPKIIFTNRLGDLNVQAWNAVDPSYESKFGMHMASWRAKVSGEFTQQLDMHAFPYDVQHVKIGISSDHVAEECHLMPNNLVKSAAQLAVFSIRDQFYVSFDTDKAVHETAPRKGAGGEYSQMIAVIDAHRNPTFFVINIILLMFLLVVVYLIAVIPISPFNVSDRMEIASNIVLTGVALKLLSAERLPDLPYLTFLDKYLLGSIGLLVAVIALLFSSYRVIPSTIAEIFDTTTLSAIGGLWIFGHVPIFYPLMPCSLSPLIRAALKCCSRRANTSESTKLSRRQITL